MKQRLSILQSKLSPPKSERTLQRDRLFEHLRAIVHKKLAIVVAGAGYGKTTLVAQATAMLPSPGVWYNLDSMDRDFSTFLSYLVAGVRNYEPEFGKDLMNRIAAPFPSKNMRQVFLLDFLEEFENQISRDMLIVLDDVHAVQECKEVTDALGFLLERSPSTLHWILISRTNLPVKISRYRVMDEVIDIEEADLSFRFEEVDGLYRSLFKVDIGEANVRRIFEKTGGWAVGLVLFLNAFKGSARSGINKSFFEIGRSRKLVFEYIEENIFQNQPETTRAFMMRSSLLSRLDPEFCDNVFHMTDSFEILNTLYEHHLLTFPGGDTDYTFRYHHLLQEFLQDKFLRTCGKTEVRRTHHQIGTAMKKCGDIHGALHHFLAGNRFEAVCRVLEGMVIADFMECPFRFVVDVVDKIPPHFLSKNPQMLHLAAKLASLEGHIAQSLEGFRTALASFEALDDAAGVLTCQKEIGFHYYLNGDILRAKRQMERLWGKWHNDTFFPVEIAGYLVFFSAILGDLEAADDYYDRARRFTGRTKSENRFISSYLDFCYAYRFHTSGDFARADELNRKSLDSFTRIGMEPLLPLAHFQTALTLFFLRNPEEGSIFAKKGIILAEKLGIYNAQYAWLLYADALNCLGKNELDRADAAADESFDIFKNQHNIWGQSAALELKGTIRREKSDLKKAEYFFRSALDIIETKAFPVVKGGTSLCLAETLIDGGNVAKAAALLKRHRQGIEISKFQCFRSHLLQARIQSSRGKSEKSVEHTFAALSSARENGYGPWVLDGLPQIAALLVECHAGGTMVSYIKELLSRGGRETKDVLCLLNRTNSEKIGRVALKLPADVSLAGATSLEIRCLGAFTVFVGGTPIPMGKWRNSKAKKLFQYLALKHDQGFVPKEVLLEFAWPDEDSARTNPRFHVAMTFLRKLLEPDLQRGVPSSYLLRRGSAYRLNLGKSGRIDFLEFLCGIERAEKLEQGGMDEAVGCYMKTESIYSGRLFEEELYEDGFFDDRERLQDRYLMVLRKIMRHWEQKENWDRCIGFADKYLNMDPYAEHVYSSLMRYHFEMGDAPRVTRVFDRCKSRITDELGFPLQKSTEALYRKLTCAHP